MDLDSSLVDSTKALKLRKCVTKKWYVLHNVLCSFVEVLVILYSLQSQLIVFFYMYDYELGRLTFGTFQLLAAKWSYFGNSCTQ